MTPEHVGAAAGTARGLLWRRDGGRTHPHPRLGWMSTWPVSRLLFTLNVVFAVMLAVLLVVGAFGLQALSTIRAYAEGEALWADSVDRAVIDLHRYAVTRDPRDYDAYLKEIAVPLGDRRARRELEKPHYDFRIVAAGFAAGGNSPADSWASALMFRWFHDVGYFKEATAVWAQADGYVLQLQALAAALHAAVGAGASAGAPDSSRVQGVLDRIRALNNALDPVERRFAATLGESARWFTGVLLRVLAGVASLFLGAGSLCCYLLWRALRYRLERLRSAALQIAEGHMDGRVPTEVHDEVGRLAATFNRMADDLARARAEVEAKNIELLTGAYQERDLIMETVPDLIFMVDAQGRLVRWNRHLEQATGRSGDQLAGRSVTAIFVDEDRAVMVRALDAAARQGEVQAEGAIAGPDGRSRPYEWRAAPLRNGEGALVGLAGAGRDIAERRAFEQALTRRAFHDALTDLPNRALFFNRLEQAVERAGRRGVSPAVMFVDLDRFKNINDTLGHEAGDELLAAVGRRLASCLRPGDTVARLGGDEFTILIENAGQPHVAAAARRILAALQPPFEVNGQSLFVSASVGVSGSERPGALAARDLLRRADLAMYEAKRGGRGRFAFFSADMATRVEDQFTLENDLRQAPQRGELQVFYQPLVDLATGQLLQVEALLRWRHPARGLLLPDAFIPLAEETGLIVPLGRWVLEESCREAVRWPAAGLVRPVAVSANLSAWQFRDPSLVTDVRRVLRETGLAPSRLKLEITESAVMRDEAATVRILERLKEIGVRLAIDDFGAGYSSLHRLKRLPVDEVKIDRSFVRGVDRDPQDAAIVRSVVRLARALRLGVTAEGIESAAVLRKVRALGCEHGQGFYIGQPLPAGSALQVLRSSAWPAPGGP